MSRRFKRATLPPPALETAAPPQRLVPIFAAVPSSVPSTGRVVYSSAPPPPPAWRDASAGHALLAQQRPLEALAVFDAALAHAGGARTLLLDRANASLGRAGALGQLGRRAEAVAAAVSACEIMPTEAECWACLGTAARSAGMHAQAEAALAHVLALDPAPDVAATCERRRLQIRRHVAAELKAREEAAAARRAAAEAAARARAQAAREAEAARVAAIEVEAAAEAERQRQREAAIALEAKRQRESKVAWTLEDALQAARALVDGHRHTEALVATDSLLRRLPDSATAMRARCHSLRARAFRQLHMGADAALSSRRLVDLAPDAAPSHFSLAQSLAMLHRYDEAGASARRALELSPSAPLAATISDFLRVAVLGSRHYTVDARLSKCEALLNHGPPHAALAAFTRLLPQLTSAGCSKGLAHAGRARCFAVMAEEERASHRGYHSSVTERLLQEQLGAARRAVDAAPASAECRLVRASALLATGDAKRAAEYFRAAALMLPEPHISELINRGLKASS